MSGPATRASGRLCREGDEHVEMQLTDSSRGRTQVQRLMVDADRILHQPTDADKKRALHASVRRWFDGAAFEQCWIGKLLIDVLPLPPPSCDGPAYLHPPSNYLQKSPLQRVLYRLLKSRNQGTELRQSDLCGCGILLRVMSQNKPAGVTEERLKQLTGPDEGVAVAGCSLQLLLELKLNGAAKGAHPAQHHALHVQYAATKKGQEDRGDMRLLILGQVRLMAALLPNPHASVNSIFINSTVLKEENFCVYRNKFGFAFNSSTRGYDSHDRLQMTHTRLCSQAVMVEVNGAGDLTPLEPELYPSINRRRGTEARGSVQQIREVLARDAAGAVAEVEVRDAVAEQAGAKSIAPQHSALALRASAATGAAAAASSSGGPALRVATPEPSVKKEPALAAAISASAVAAPVHVPSAAAPAPLQPAMSAAAAPHASGAVRPRPAAAAATAAADDDADHPAKRARTEDWTATQQGLTLTGDPTVAPMVALDPLLNRQSAMATATPAPSAVAAAAIQPPTLPPMEVDHTSAEPAAPCVQPAAPMSLCSFDDEEAAAAANRSAAAALFASQNTEGTVPAVQDNKVAIKQESLGGAPASLAGDNAVASAPPIHAVTALPCTGPLSPAVSSSPSRARQRVVIDLVDSDDDDDDAAAVSSVATASGAAEPRIKLEAGMIASLPQVKLEAIAVMRGALPHLSEIQLWELLSAHGHNAAAAIQAHILAQFAVGRSTQDQ